MLNHDDAFNGNDAVQLVRLGHGPPVILVHGGPGFSHRYLLDALSFLASSFELVCYDQIGCGSRPQHRGPITLDDLADEFLQVLQRTGSGDGVQVIAHSWGCLIVAAAADQTEGRRLIASSVSGGVLINPLPLDYSAFQRSYYAFVQQIPLRRRLEVIVRGLLNDEQGVIRRLWPYYFAPDNAVPEMKPDFDLAAYRSAMRGLGAYDVSAALQTLERFSILLAEYDATKVELIEAWRQSCKNYSFLAGVGHFPMLERPQLWQSAILRALTLETDVQ